MTEEMLSVYINFVKMIHVSVNLLHFIVNIRHNNNKSRQHLTVSGHVAISIYRVNLAFVNLQMMVLPVWIKVVIPGITFTARFLLMDPYVARRILNIIILLLKYFLLKFFHAAILMCLFSLKNIFDDHDMIYNFIFMLFYAFM